MTPEDARELREALREETAALRDPAGLAFAGGTSAATREAGDALAAQLADVPATARLLRGALPGPDTEGVLDGYAEALTAAVEAVRSGRPPEQVPVSQPPVTVPVAAPPPGAPGTPPAAGTGRPPPKAVAAALLGLAALIVVVVLLVVVIAGS